MSCVGDTCGVGDWGGPKPGDPSNNSVLQAKPAIGGVELSWTMPTVNPFAVAHTLVYRSISEHFVNAIQIATWNGDQYLDRVASGTQYWYWIRFISVNGTEGELIGPASAFAYDTVEQLLIDLTGQIDQSVLSAALKERIEAISLLSNDLLKEIQDRFGADSAMASAVASLQSNVDTALTVFEEEIIQRTEGDTALVDAMELMGVRVGENASAITNEATLRADADEALATQINKVGAQIGGTFTGFKTWDFRDNLLGWVVSGAIHGFDGENLGYTSTGTDPILISPAISIPGSQYKKIRAKVRRNHVGTWQGALYYTTANHGHSESFVKVIEDTSVVGEWRILEWDMSAIPDWTSSTITSIRIDLARQAEVNFYVDWISIGADSPPVGDAVVQVETTARIAADESLAGQLTTVQSTLNGNIAQVAQDLSTEINTLEGTVNSLYTVRLNVNDLVGGYGLANNGSVVSAGFDVDSFFVGRTNANKIKPFMIVNDIVYMNSAFISSLTVDKITSGAMGAEWRLTGPNARIVMDNGVVMKVQGNGFGAQGNLLTWFGPSMPVNQCSTANATNYETTAGAAYWGGTLRAGTLYNAQRTTQTVFNAEVPCGPFSSNGNIKSVVLSYSFGHQWQNTNSATWNMNSYTYTTGSPYATVELLRSFNNGPYVSLRTTTFNGDIVINNEVDAPDTAGSFVSGSFTVTDNVGAGNYTYLARITARGNANFSHPDGLGTLTIVQSLGIVSTEE